MANESTYNPAEFIAIMSVISSHNAATASAVMGEGSLPWLTIDTETIAEARRLLTESCRASNITAADSAAAELRHDILSGILKALGSRRRVSGRLFRFSLKAINSSVEAGASGFSADVLSHIEWLQKTGSVNKRL